MKVLIVLAVVAACAYSATASPRSYGDDDGIAVVEVDYQENYDNSLEDAVIREELSDLDQEPEDIQIPQGIVEEEVGGGDYESETPELPEETDVTIVVVGDDSVPEQDDTTTTATTTGTTTTTATTTGTNVASNSAPNLPRADVFVSQSDTNEDAKNLHVDLINLINAFKYEKQAFDHMLDRTSQMKMDNKTQCLSEAVNKITSSSVDATNLDNINLNLTNIYSVFYNREYDDKLLAKYREQILTGNDTFIVRILDESAAMTKAMETAFITNTIDSEC